MSKLESKVALVTGASKGIGAGIAKALASAGAAVVVNYASDRSGAEAVVNAIIKAGGRAAAAHADVSKPVDVARMFAEVTRAFGTLDILVNNAGVYRPMPLVELTDEEFHREINTNLFGPLLTIRESLKHFGLGGGSIINIGSAVSRMHPPGYSVYTASKAGLDAVTGVLAKELAPRKIRVNSVNPGATFSEGTRYASGHRQSRDISCLGRLRMAHRRNHPCIRRTALTHIPSLPRRCRCLLLWCSYEKRRST